MTNNESIYVLSAARTAIGKFGGSLASFGPIELGTFAAKEAIKRSGLDANEIETAVFGTVVPTTPRDLYLSRAVALESGLPESSIAMNVNRLCGSGLQAIVTGAQQLLTGDAGIALVGGAESMSNAPHTIPGMRFGNPMGPGKVVDWLTETLTCPMGNGGMGITAENVAEHYGISREDQDAFALQSQERAQAAIAAGTFKDEIVPVTVKTRKGEVIFDTDEHPRATTLETLAKLKPSFKKDGTVTAGNSSGINDGGAALILTTESSLSKTSQAPLARIVGWGVAGVDPAKMGIGPIAAVPVALKRAGLELSDIDLIESNEAFAAQALAVERELGFDPAITNPDGGAVALGHPVGATGAILTTKAAYKLKATGKKYGLITMCIGGGQGIALIIEAV